MAKKKPEKSEAEAELERLRELNKKRQQAWRDRQREERNKKRSG